MVPKDTEKHLFPVVPSKAWEERSQVFVKFCFNVFPMSLYYYDNLMSYLYIVKQI